MQKTPKILVVDDDPDILSLLTSFLASQNYLVETAQNGEEALVKYRAGAFDIIISDMVMPHVNGIELLEQICAREGEVIFIMISGYSDINRAITAMKLGAYDYILKPFDLEDLRMRILRALEKKLLRDQLRYTRGLTWALLISVPIWLVLGIFLAALLR